MSLNTETLNRKFYRELYEWYDWAKSECRFPDGETETQSIRMITPAPLCLVFEGERFGAGGALC